LWDGNFSRSRRRLSCGSEAYTKELLEKYEVTWGQATDAPNYKVPKVEEIEEGEAELLAGEAQKAQAWTGALLWLSARTTPDLAHGVAAMSRLTTGRPDLSLQIGQLFLQYVAGGVLGLYYGVDAGPEWGRWQQLAVERTKNLVEVHTDISYGHRSTQGVIALYAGAPILWSTTRQPFAVSEYSKGGVGRTL